MSRGRAAALALLLLTGACAADTKNASPDLAEPFGQAAGQSVDGRTLPGDRMELRAVQTPKLGEVLVDHEQYTLYRYEKDSTNPPKSSCTEPECTLVWVPLLTAEVQSTNGIDAALLGIMERPDGTKQVTLNGHPLYRYVYDEGAGDTTGDGIDNMWFAVAPNGEKARD